LRSKTQPTEKEEASPRGWKGEFVGKVLKRSTRRGGEWKKEKGCGKNLGKDSKKKRLPPDREILTGADKCEKGALGKKRR